MLPPPCSLAAQPFAERPAANRHVAARQNSDSLLGIANRTDGGGNHLYSGFRGSTQPFGGATCTGSPMGDDVPAAGARLIRQPAIGCVSDSGYFERQRGGGFAVAADPLNKGRAIGGQTITDANKCGNGQQ